MTAEWSPEQRAAFYARRRSRNIALGLVLGALVVLFFGISIVRMADGSLNGKPNLEASATAPAVTGRVK